METDLEASTPTAPAANVFDQEGIKISRNLTADFPVLAAAMEEQVAIEDVPNDDGDDVVIECNINSK